MVLFQLFNSVTETEKQSQMAHKWMDLAVWMPLQLYLQRQLTGLIHSEGHLFADPCSKRWSMFYLITMCFIVSCFFKKNTPCPLCWNTLNPTTILETNLLFCSQMDPSFLWEPYLDFKPGSRFLFQTPQHATSQLTNTSVCRSHPADSDLTRNMGHALSTWAFSWDWEHLLGQDLLNKLMDTENWS